VTAEGRDTTILRSGRKLSDHHYDQDPVTFTDLFAVQWSIRTPR
jgi:hypothetical protein